MHVPNVASTVLGHLSMDQSTSRLACCHKLLEHQARANKVHLTEYPVAHQNKLYSSPRPQSSVHSTSLKEA